MILLGQASYSVYIWQQIAYVNKNRFGVVGSMVVALSIGFLMHHLYDLKASVALKNLFSPARGQRLLGS